MIEYLCIFFKSGIYIILKIYIIKNLYLIIKIYIKYSLREFIYLKKYNSRYN